MSLDSLLDHPMTGKICGEDDASDMHNATSHTETVSMVASLTLEERIFLNTDNPP